MIVIRVEYNTSMICYNYNSICAASAFPVFSKDSDQRVTIDVRYGIFWYQKYYSVGMIE
jgi:hypothetical protein